MFVDILENEIIKARIMLGYSKKECGRVLVAKNKLDDSEPRNSFSLAHYYEPFLRSSVSYSSIQIYPDSFMKIL